MRYLYAAVLPLVLIASCRSTELRSDAPVPAPVTQETRAAASRPVAAGPSATQPANTLPATSEVAELERKVEEIRERMAPGKATDLELLDAQIALGEARLRHAVVTGQRQSALQALDVLAQVHGQKVQVVQERLRVGKAAGRDLPEAALALYEVQLRLAIMRNRAKEALAAADGAVRAQQQNADALRELLQVGKVPPEESATATRRLDEWRALRQQQALAVEAQDRLYRLATQPGGQADSKVVGEARADLAAARWQVYASAALLMPAASDLLAGASSGGGPLAGQDTGGAAASAPAALQSQAALPPAPRSTSAATDEGRHDYEVPRPAADAKVNLVIRDFPPMFADYNSMQGVPGPVIAEPKPAFCKSDKPLLFDLTKGGVLPVKIILDQSAGPGGKYDTLYMDFNGNENFLDDPVYEASPFDGSGTSMARLARGYFRDVHIVRNRANKVSAHVQVFIMASPSWPANPEACYLLFMAQKWAVGTVKVDGKDVPAALIDRTWNDSFIDALGLNPAEHPNVFPRSDYLVLAIDGEDRLISTGQFLNEGGTAYALLAKHLQMNSGLYEVKSGQSPEGVRLELLPAAPLPMGELEFARGRRLDPLMMIGINTCVLLKKPGQTVRVPADTYYVPASLNMPGGDALVTVDADDGAQPQATPSEGATTQPADGAASVAAAADLSATQPTADAAEGTTMEPKATVAKILATYARAAQQKAKVRNLHVVTVTEVRYWTESLGQYVYTPSQGSEVWAWYEALNEEARMRIDLDPLRQPMGGTGRAYVETRCILAYDGEMSNEYRFQSSGGVHTAQPVEQLREPLDFRHAPLHPSMSGLDLLPTGLEGDYASMNWDDLRLGNGNLYRLWAAVGAAPDAVRARQVVKDGQTLVELTAVTPQAGGSTIKALLDPARGYAVRSIVMTRQEESPWTLEVAEYTQIAEDLWLPVASTSRMMSFEARSRSRVELLDAKQADAIFHARDVKVGAAMRSLPHGPNHPGTPAAPPAAAPASPPPLGPLTQWVPQEGERFIDLDTGSTARRPEGLTDPAAIQEWLTRQGIDLVWERGQRGAWLVFADAAMQPFESEDWPQRFTAERVWKEMEQAGPGSPLVAVELGDSRLPAVFLIRTREGGLGTLRVRKTRSTSGDVEVQYKMLERPEALDVARLSPAQRAEALVRAKTSREALTARLADLRAETEADDPRIAQGEKQLQVLGRQIEAMEQAQKSDVKEGAASQPVSPASAPAEPVAAASQPASATQAQNGPLTGLESLLGERKPYKVPTSQPGQRCNLVWRDFPPGFGDYFCIQGTGAPAIPDPRPEFCKSDRPLLFHTPKGTITSAILFDQSTPDGPYDTLYVDLNDNGDFLDDPVYHAQAYEGVGPENRGKVHSRFSNVQVIRNKVQNLRPHVQVFLREVPSNARNQPPFAVSLIPQRWAVGTVRLKDRDVPAAVLDRTWNDNAVEKAGLNLNEYKDRYPRGDYLILEPAGGQELRPGPPMYSKKGDGSPRTILNEYLQIGEDTYKVNTAQFEEGVQLDLSPVQLPMGKVRVQIAARDSRVIGLKTSVLLPGPAELGEAIVVPVDTYALLDIDAAFEAPAAVEPGQTVDLPKLPFRLEPGPLRKPVVGDVAPTFETTTLDGKPLKLADYRGRLVLLDFWAAWCGPCVAEIPNLRSLHERFGKGGRLAVISLSLDEDTDMVEAFQQKQPMPWTQCFLAEKERADITRKYGVNALPATFLIGPDGKILAVDLHGQQIAEVIEKALAAPTAAAKAPASGAAR